MVRNYERFYGSYSRYGDGMGSNGGPPQAEYAIPA